MTALRARPRRARREKATPGLDRDDRARAAPRPGHLSRDDDRAWPHARCPELGTSGRIAHEELAVGALEEEVGVAARQEPRGCRLSVDWRAECLLVLGQDPPLAARRVHGRQRSRERLERGPAPRGLDPRPLCERLRCRRSEHMEVPARELESGVDRIDLWPRHRPDRRLPRAVPTHEHPAGRARRSAATRDGGRARAPPRGSPSADPRESLRCDRQGLGIHARRAGASGIRATVNSARSTSATTYALKRGPHTCTRDGSSQVPGSVPSTRAWIERSAALGMLSCSPAHAATRSDFAPAGSRRSRPPTRRRNASTCERVSSSRRLAAFVTRRCSLRADRPAAGKYGWRNSLAGARVCAYGSSVRSRPRTTKPWSAVVADQGLVENGGLMRS